MIKTLMLLALAFMAVLFILHTLAGVVVGMLSFLVFIAAFAVVGFGFAFLKGH